MKAPKKSDSIILPVLPECIRLFYFPIIKKKKHIWEDIINEHIWNEFLGVRKLYDKVEEKSKTLTWTTVSTKYWQNNFEKHEGEAYWFFFKFWVFIYEHLHRPYRRW